jgi:hypothetical protein
MAMVVEWGMMPCTSESSLILFYIKYLCGLIVQSGHIEMILMVGFPLKKKTEYMNCFSHAAELLRMCN